MKIKWTYQALEIEALKYKTRNEFAKLSPNAYQSAYVKNMLNEICKHMPNRVSMKGENNPRFKWSLELLKLEALKYSNRTDFSIKSAGAYQSANDINILDEICSHMTIPHVGEKNGNFKWTNEHIIDTAKQYLSRSQFKTLHPTLYSAARDRKILNEACKHMKYINNLPYNESDLRLIALKYNTRRDFRDNEYGAYQAASKLKLLNTICKHMKKSRDTSNMELDLLKDIKNIYTSASKFKDYKVKIENKPHIKRFEIDIFIPELNKGIEFDGKYWHSFERLKQARPNWTDNDIKNYHHIKDDWFKSKGIEILHIKEENWLKNKDLCLKNIFEFLNQTQSLTNIDQKVE